MVVFSAIEELHKDTEEGWKKLAIPLDQVIEANNASNVGLKKRDVQLALGAGAPIISGHMLNTLRIQSISDHNVLSGQKSDTFKMYPVM